MDGIRAIRSHHAHIDLGKGRSMTVEDAQNALADLVARGAGNVRLVGFDADGNHGPVDSFEVDAGEDEPVVWVEIRAAYVFSGRELAALMVGCVAVGVLIGVVFA